MEMSKLEKVIKEFEHLLNAAKGNYQDFVDLTVDGGEEILASLKEQEAVPNELKLKMWNALYAKEDEYEKKFVGTYIHHEWFSTYRPWLQMGFNIAIDAIADWEGR